MARTWTIGIAGWALGLTPAHAQTFPDPLCPGETAMPAADGRMLGHIPYAELAPGDLVAAPAGFGVGGTCRVARDVAPDLARMLADAAAAPGVGQQLKGVSCHRSIARQRSVFCGRIGPRRAARDAADRAREVAPPGFSEHGTGYAIDFAVRPSRNCADVDPCIAATTVGQWLLAHATDYGFELSFPAGNAQGVAWEPWHWRWVGRTREASGALRARLLFARARADFPANPGIPDRPEQVVLDAMFPPAPPSAAPAVGAEPLRP